MIGQAKSFKTMGKTFEPSPSQLQVLSLAGGGFMGLFTATVLEALEEKYRRFYDTTEVFAGTSVGSLLALGLASGRSAKDIASTMRDVGPDIFPPSALPLVSKVKNAWKPKYKTEELRNVIESLVGKKKLGDLERHVIVPAVDLTAGSYRVFRGGGDSIDAEIPVVDVALASAAAPTYFPVHPIETELFADGGLIANAPDAIAAQEALGRLGGRKDRTRMIAIGTTLVESGAKSDVENLDWGALEWLPQLLKFTMAGQVSLARAMAAEALGASNTMVIDPLQSASQSQVVGLDKADKIAADTLDAIAKQAMRELLDPVSGQTAFFQRWNNHNVVSPKPTEPSRAWIRSV